MKFGRELRLEFRRATVITMSLLAIGLALVVVIAAEFAKRPQAPVEGFVLEGATPLKEWNVQSRGERSRPSSRSAVGSRPTGEAFTVHVVDRAGDAVSNASIIAHQDDIYSRVGASAGDGRFEIDFESISSWESVLAFSDSMASDEVPIDPKTQREVQLTLRPAGTIAGTVVCGEKPVEGVFCAVAPPSESLSQEGGSLLAESNDPRRIAVSRLDGSFEIHGLDPNLRYSLVCGGRGFAASRRVVGGDERDVRIEVLAIYGTLIELTEPGGAPIHFPANAEPYPATGATSLGARIGTYLAPQYTLSGLPPYDEIRESGRIPLFAALSDFPEKAGPVSWGGMIQGYGHVSVKAWLYPVRDGLKIQRVEVTPTFSRRGDLEIALARSRVRELDEIRDHEIGELRVVAKGPEPRAGYRVRIRRDSPEVVRFSGIPEGDYYISFAPLSQLFVTSQQVVSVGGETARVRLSIETSIGEQSGAVQLEPVAQDGRKYLGSLICSFTSTKRPGDGVGRTFTLLPPYVIDLLPSGACIVDILASPDGTLYGCKAETVVLSGRVARVGVSLTASSSSR